MPTILVFLVVSSVCSLSDIIGKPVSDWEIGSGTPQSFSTNNLPAGIYILQVWDSSGYMKREVKVLKE